MGTNFYLLDETHLGKRSFAGAYCYECNISLVTGQSGGYDVANPHAQPPPPNWNGGYNLQALIDRASARRCCGCGRGPREVGGATSFSFAQPPEWIGGLPADTPMENEYGDKMTVGEFRSELLECKFFFTDHVGVEFS